MPIIETEKSVIDGRYRLERLLGEGQYTTTHLATDLKKERSCVVKSLSLHTLDKLKSWELFERETKILANLHHPRIPDFYDYIGPNESSDHRMHLIQEYVEGRNLAQILENGRFFAEEDVRDLCLQVVEILEYLHGFSPAIIHRDIKPSNIVLTENGEVWLIDFGAIRERVITAERIHRESPTIVGTYGYMPFEQFEGRAAPASDIYSLGATLIFLLSRRDPADLERDGMTLNFRPFVQISEDFAKIIEKMVEPNWHNRYRSAGELKADLERLGGGIPSPAIRQKKIGRLPKALGALIVGGAMLGFLYFWMRPAHLKKPLQLAPQEPLKIEKIDLQIAPELKEVFIPDDPLPESAVRRFGSMRLRHAKNVRNLAYSRNGKLLVSVAEDNIAVLWDGATGKRIGRLEYPGAISYVAFFPGSRKIITIDPTGTSIIFDAKTRLPIKRLLNLPFGRNAGAPISASADGDLLAIAGKDSIQIWDPERGEALRLIDTGGKQLGGLGFANIDAKLFSYDFATGDVVVWNARSGKALQRFRFQSYQEKFISFTPDDRQLMVRTGKTMTLLDIETGQKAAEYTLEQNRYSGISNPFFFIPPGRQLAIVIDNSVRLLESGTGRPVSGFATGHPWLTYMDWAPEKGLLATAGGDQALQIWNLKQGEREVDPYGHNRLVKSMDVSPDNRAAATWGADNRLILWDIESARPMVEYTWEVKRKDWGYVRFLPGNRILVASNDLFRIWDLKTGYITTEKKFDSTVGNAAVSPDGRWLVAAGEAITLWELETGTSTGKIGEFDAKKHPRVGFTPDGKRIYSTAKNSRLRLWDLAGANEVSTGNMRFAGYDLEFAGNGKYVAAASNPLVYVYDANSNYRKIGYFAGRGPVAFSADTRKMASINKFGEIEVRSLPSLKTSHVFKGHRGKITGLRFLSGNRYLLAASEDTTLLLWDTEGKTSAEPPQAPAEPATPGTSKVKSDTPKISLSFDHRIQGPGVIPTTLGRGIKRLGFVPGVKGQALHFSGKLELPELRALNLGAACTFQLWLRLDRSPSWEKGEYQGLLQSDFISLGVNRERKIDVVLKFPHQGGHGGMDLSKAMEPLEPLRWYHLALVWDPGEKAVQFYLDGRRLDAKGGDYHRRFSRIPSNFRLGYHSQVAIDELFIYNYARTAEQIAMDADKRG